MKSWTYSSWTDRLFKFIIHQFTRLLDGEATPTTSSLIIIIIVNLIAFQRNWRILVILSFSYVPFFRSIHSYALVEVFEHMFGFTQLTTQRHTIRSIWSRDALSLFVSAWNIFMQNRLSFYFFHFFFRKHARRNDEDKNEEKGERRRREVVEV